MSKQIALLLNDLANEVYGYPKQVASIDAEDRLLVEVDNRYVEHILQTAIDTVRDHKPIYAMHPDQLSFDF